MDYWQSNRTDRQPDTASREVSAVVIHLHVSPLLIQVGNWPQCGAPSWANLDDDDPAKLAAVSYAALQWVLLYDIAHEAEREAAQAVRRGTDWAAIRQELQQREKSTADGVRIPRVSA